MQRTKLGFMVLLLAIVHTTAPGQFSASGSLSTMYDDNIDNTYLQTADRIGSLSGGLAHEWEFENDDIEFGYNGSLYYYSTAVERTFHYHTLSGTYIHLLTEEGESKLTVEGSYSLRFDRGDFTLFDHKDFVASAVLTLPFAGAVRGEFTYALRSLTFPSANELNSLDNAGSFRMTASFPSRTTLIVETSLGSKAYVNTVSTGTQTGSLHGRGKGASGSETPSVVQWGIMIRAGQSIMEGMGLSASVSHQTNFQSGSRYLSPAFSSGTADNVFDDHYGYEGWGGSLKLTQILFNRLTMRAIGDVQGRDYTGRAAYTLEGGLAASLRSDTRKSLSFEAEYELSAYSISLGFEYLRNASNDQSFMYSNTTLMLGVSLPF